MRILVLSCFKNNDKSAKIQEKKLLFYNHPRGSRAAHRAVGVSRTAEIFVLLDKGFYHRAQNGVASVRVVAFSVDNQNFLLNH